MSGGRSQTLVYTGQLTERLLKLSDEINRSGVARGSSVKLIKRACKHITILKGETENLSQRLADLIASAKIRRHDADIISKLLEL